MPEPLQPALGRLRTLLLDEASLVRAVASGRQRGNAPRWRRAELRYVDLKAGRRLQVTVYDQTQAHTANHAPAEAAAAVDALLEEPFGNWYVETATQRHQLRVTKKREASVHTATLAAADPRPVADGDTPRPHDRAKPRLLPEDDPVLAALGFLDDRGRLKPSRQAKYRQVEEFLRDLAPVVDDAVGTGRLHRPTAADPLRVVDLGCGNAYLTFAAHRYLTAVRGLSVHTTGVDVKAQSREHNTAVAASLGLSEEITFVQAEIGSVELSETPDVVLALHACDTATDDALARAVRWQAPVVLAAPCCHHDVAAQLRRSPAPAPYALLTRNGILRERFADTLTDAMRAAVLRTRGYRVDVVDFVDSRHTPRNTLLRAVRTGAGEGGSEGGAGVRRELEELTTSWGVRPRLSELLGADSP
jgi:SAM-dependent methyltransferase